MPNWKLLICNAMNYDMMMSSSPGKYATSTFCLSVHVIGSPVSKWMPSEISGPPCICSLRNHHECQLQDFLWKLTNGIYMFRAPRNWKSVRYVVNYSKAALSGWTSPQQKGMPHLFSWGVRFDPYSTLRAFEIMILTLHAPDYCRLIHSKLRSITSVAIKVHVILQSFVVLTWMRDTIELV